MTRIISFTEAINEALFIAMNNDPKVICYGLGVDDPKNIFGTTKGLQETFGKERVFDTPTSENTITGMSIGLGMCGYRSVMVHQRLDFFLLAMDQLVNGAAKWRYMFGGIYNVPITIRLILGRGWGQGPTHSQSLQSWFAHIPGLKVVMPSSPANAKGLLLESIFDDNPVVFLEHRWLHNQLGHVPEDDYRVQIGKPQLRRKGSDITLISMSYMNLEAEKVAKFLIKKNISCEILDLCSINPIDWKVIYESVTKTGRVIVLDTASETGSFSGEVISRISINCFDRLKSPPKRVASPDTPCPTSFGLTKQFYPEAKEIANVIKEIFDIDYDVSELDDNSLPHDIPGEWFKGPF